MNDQQGSAAITVVVFMPLLVAVLAGVIELGALRVLAARTLTVTTDGSNSAPKNGTRTGTAAAIRTVGRS